nr:chemotaxis response regulator protein-glutamate methylesterase [Paenibacillus sediminis]
MVVDDSAFMRKIISDLIESDSSFRVAGTARNGIEAVEKISSLKPDLVTMDVEMPDMNGLDALKMIMKKHPLPVIMLSGINEQGMRETIMALELGAFDFIRKPSVSSTLDIKQVGEALLEQLHAAIDARERKAAREAALQQMKVIHTAPSGPKMIDLLDLHKPEVTTAKNKPLQSAAKKEQAALNHHSAQEARTQIAKAKEAPKKKEARQDTSRRAKSVLERKDLKPISKTKQLPSATAATMATKHAGNIERSAEFTQLVAIGCSTGGPKALKTLLEQFPASFPAPIVIVQHMPPNFTKSLAQRLNTFSQLEVVEAEDGMILRKGTAYIAPGGYHLTVAQAAGGHFVASLSQSAPRNGHCPSVDTMFESLLPLQSLKRHVVLLTGMGSDGARVMKQLYDAGVHSTFAESEETCVVYGMPRSAVELHCVEHILPLHEIAPKLVQVVK